MMGWHFTNGFRLRDGQPLEAGRVYRVQGPLVLCERGLHFSARALDALNYAPGTVVSRVESSGTIRRGDDKACATTRRVVWCADAGRTLRAFAITVATEALEMVEARGYRVDPRSRSALRVAAAYLAGAATRNALRAAQHEAWAARSTARSAADATAFAAAATATATAAEAAALAAAAAEAAAAADAARRQRCEAMNAMLTTMLEALAP